MSDLERRIIETIQMVRDNGGEPKKVVVPLGSPSIENVGLPVEADREADRIYIL